MASVIGNVRADLSGSVARATSCGRPSPSATPFPFNAPHRLPFYRARNAIYHLFRALLETNPALTVLAPDYNSGNEILAMQAAGATIHYCPVGRDMQLGSGRGRAAVRRPQPRPPVRHPLRRMAAADAGARRAVPPARTCCSSRTARSRCSANCRWPRRSALRRLVGLLPLQDAAAAQRRAARAERPRLEALERLRLRRAGIGVGRSAARPSCWCSGFAAAPTASARRCRRSSADWAAAAGALDVQRANVGDIGFNLDEVDLAMSPRVRRGCSSGSTSTTSAAARRELSAAARSSSTRTSFAGVSRSAGRRVPAVLPDRRAGQAAAADALRARGVDALEFWNDPVG